MRLAFYALFSSSSPSASILSSPQFRNPLLSLPRPPLIQTSHMAAATSAAAKFLLPPAALSTAKIRLAPPSASFLSFPCSLKTLSNSSSSLRHLPNPKHSYSVVRCSATAAPATSPTVAVGSKLPDATLSYLDAAGQLQTVTVSDLTKGKKAILFAVPGAFTPTCSQKHLPGFVEKAAELKAKGVDTIACISVNDAFVMRAWKENLNITGDDVLLLSDGNGEFTRALGVQLDLSDKPVGLGVRSRRYALLADDGVVKFLNLEEGGAFTFSSAEDMLKVL